MMVVLMPLAIHLKFIVFAIELDFACQVKNVPGEI
jgi:hypothetical protein